MSSMLTASLLSGLATGMGGVMVTLWKEPREGYLTALLGLAAGIMLSVIVFDLMPASLMYGGPLPALLGFLCGCLVLWLLDAAMTRCYPCAPTGNTAVGYFRKLGYLIAVGIALHDLPEGMAIAVGYESSQKMGLIIALSIAVHNIPEGIAIATPLKMGRVGTIPILIILTLLALFTPLGSLFGLLLLVNSQQYLSFFLSFAAGAMSYIVKDELLPALRGGGRLLSYTALVVGFALIGILTMAH